MSHQYHQDEESLSLSSSADNDFAHHLAEQEAINESIQLQLLQQQQQQLEQQRREQIEQEVAIEQALRASLQEQQKAQDEALAASLHQDEIQSAEDEEYATAVQESDHHATALQLNESMENDAKRYKTSRNDDVAQGSWDCPLCTYTNPPYHAQTCFMCHASPPPLHALTFASIPPTLRFGVEIEIIIPRGKADGYTLPRIAQELTRLGPPNVQFRGYNHETEAVDWKIVTDASIRGTNSNNNVGDHDDDADL
jgi:rubrerythrin